MRRLNYRLLLSLIVLAGVGGASLYGLHSIQKQRHAKGFLREAHKAQEMELPAVALDYFQRYLSLVPDDVEAQADYGRQLALLGYDEAAFLTLDAVVRRRPERNDLRRLLAEVGLRIGRFGDAESQLKLMLGKSAKDSELLTWLAMSQAGRHDYPSAAATLRKAIEIAPQNLRSYEVLAELMERQIKAPEDDVIAVIDQMVSSNKSSADAFVRRSRWRLAHKTQDPEEQRKLFVGAFEDAVSAAKIFPESFDAAIQQGRAELRLARSDDARQTARRALAIRSNHSAAYRLLADIELANRRPAEAADWLSKGVEAVPADLDLCWNLVALRLDLGQTEDIAGLIQRLTDEKYQPAAVAFLQARQRVAQGEWLGASNDLEALRPSLTVWPDLVRQVDYWLGVCYQNLGNTDQQLVAMRRAVAADSAWPPARAGLAAALVAAGHIQEALEEYQVLINKPETTVDATLNYIRLSFFDQLSQPLQKRNFEPILGLLGKIEQALPDSIPPSVLRAEILVAQQQPEEALKVLRSRRQQRPEAKDLWTAEIALLHQLRRWPDFDELLAGAEAHFGDLPAWRAARARAAIYREGANAKTDLEELAKLPESWSEQQKAQAATDLAVLNMTIGEFAEAQKLAKSVAESQTNNLKVRLLLLDIAFQLRDKEQIQTALNGIEGVEGKGPLWHYGIAISLGIEAETEKDPALYKAASEHLAAARTLRPGWARIALLNAEFAERQNQKALAADRYLEAIEQGDQQPNTIKKLVRLLFDQKRFAEADKLLRSAQEKRGGFSDELMLLASNASYQNDDYKRALDLAQQIASNSDRYEDQLWLGQLSHLLKQYGDAEKELRRVIVLDKSRPEAWLSLVLTLSMAGKKQEALEAIHEAEAAIAPDERSLVVAQCYQTVGENSLAREQYAQALKDRPDDPKTLRGAAQYYLDQLENETAEPLLQQLMQQQNDEAVRGWARRNLATTLAAKGGPTAFQEAQKLLAASSAREDDDDRRTLAYVLARSPIRAQRQRAIELLNQLVADPASVQHDDRFILASLYFKEGQLSRANSEMRAAIPLDPKRYLPGYLDQRLERRELSEVEVWLPKLKEISPDLLSTISIECRLAAGRKRFDDARKLLSTTLASALKADAAASGKNASGIRQWGARLAEQLASLAESVDAEKKLFLEQARSILTDESRLVPANSLLLASFQLRLGEMDAALQTAEAGAAAAAPDAMLGFFVDQYLLSGNGDQKSNERLETLLKATKESRMSNTLGESFANLLSWTGKYREAEAAYRDLLKVDPDNLTALNGLSALLATRGTNPREAIELIDHAISVGGPLGAFLDTRGLARMAAKQLTEAQADFEQAIREEGTADRYFHQSQCLQQLRNDDAARRMLKEAEKAGLLMEKLHPLEREALQKLRTELKATSRRETVMLLKTGGFT